MRITSLSEIIVRTVPATALLSALLALLFTTPPVGAEPITIAVREPLGLKWGPDRIDETVRFPQGQADRAGIHVLDEKGQVFASQLSDVELWPDGKSVKSTRLSLMVTLEPHQQRHFTVKTFAAPTAASNSEINVRLQQHVLELSNRLTGIRIAGGSQTYDPAIPGDQVPAPIQGVRLTDNQWIGKGAWQTNLRCAGFETVLLDHGPVFARARMTFRFEGGRSYQATVELNAGQDVAIITESYDLSEGQKHPMSGLSGMKSDVLYQYVRPTFPTPERALLWDWWGQTMAKLPTFNAYSFTFHEGLEPDSADFIGGRAFGNLKPGDGGLTFDKNGRFAYINAYMQWGDEEGTFIGLYNSKTPERQIALTGLRPSQWLHPNLEPRPDAVIQQYVQTTCIRLERRTSGEVFFQAPVDLGRRVFALGSPKRSLARHILPERSGPRLSEQPIWGSDLPLRHVRLGRLELDTVRKWVLDYEEPAAYPRLYVSPGDRATYESRRTRKPVDQVRAELAARNSPTPAESKAVTDALTMARNLVNHIAQIDKGHMDFGIETGILSDLAEDALSSPACSPQQARELRSLLAMLVHFSQHPDFVPPRTAGFGWGSANMMEQVQCRAARLAALLPSHPMNGSWRESLAHFITHYVENQINPAGVTMECPHYGAMAINMPAMALRALSSAGPIDTVRADERLRAAAHARLGTLLPPDVRGGIRSQLPQGDGYYSVESTFPILAGYFQKTDPLLASQLMWGVQESGGELDGHTEKAFKMLDVGLQATVPELASAHYRGQGVVMRQGFPRPDETHLQVYGDDFNWGHGHSDRGAFVFHAKGAPLMMDFAAMYTPSMRQNWLHPGGIAFDVDETVRPAASPSQDAWWREGPNAKLRESAPAPFTALEIRPSPASNQSIDRGGKVTTFITRPEADYCVIQRQVSYLHRVPYLLQPVHGTDLFDDQVNQEINLVHPFLFKRQILFVKDPDPEGTSYFVFRDDLTGNRELLAYLNLWALASEVKVDASTIVYTGQHGVDLHCFVAEPARFEHLTRTVGHTQGMKFAGRFKKKFGKEFREDQVQLRIAQPTRGAGFFVAIVPVRQGEPSPQFQTLAGGEAIRVSLRHRHDTVVLRNGRDGVQTGGREIRSVAAVVRESSGGTHVTEFE